MPWVAAFTQRLRTGKQVFRKVILDPNTHLYIQRLGDVIRTQSGTEYQKSEMVGDPEFTFMDDTAVQRA